MSFCGIMQVSKTASFTAISESRKHEQNATIESSGSSTNHGGRRERRAMEKSFPEPKNVEEPWKVLEFYSGIGGMVLGLFVSYVWLCINKQ